MFDRSHLDDARQRLRLATKGTTKCRNWRSLTFNYMISRNTSQHNRQQIVEFNANSYDFLN